MQVIKLSDAVQALPRQSTCFCHGVPQAFLDVGKRMAPGATAAPNDGAAAANDVHVQLTASPGGSTHVSLETSGEALLALYFPNSRADYTYVSNLAVMAEICSIVCRPACQREEGWACAQWQGNLHQGGVLLGQGGLGQGPLGSVYIQPAV